MSGDRNFKMYASLLIMVGAIILLFVVNNLLMQQIDDIHKHNAGKEITPALPQAAVSSVKTRPGIPAIDPLNDPLAPVAKKASRKEQPRSEKSPTELQKIYDIPLDSPILIQ